MSSRKQSPSPSRKKKTESVEDFKAYPPYIITHDDRTRKNILHTFAGFRVMIESDVKRLKWEIQRMGPEVAAIAAAQTDVNLWTPLHTAAAVKGGNDDAARELLKVMNADAINKTDVNGWTAARLARESGNRRVVTLINKRKSELAVAAAAAKPVVEAPSAATPCDYSKMKVAELRKLCKEKDEKIAQLLAVIAANVAAAPVAEVCVVAPVAEVCVVAPPAVLANYKKMKVVELKQLCKTRKIKGFVGKRKEELITMLTKCSSV